MEGSKVLGVYSGKLKTYGHVPANSYAVITLPSEVKVNTIYTGQFSNVMISVGQDLNDFEVCNAPSVITTGLGLTRYDCCLSKHYDTCIYFTTNDTQYLPMSPNRCVASYDGYGSSVGTPCMDFYSSESRFYTPVMPTSGDVYTDFGQTPVLYKFDCYVENWSNYRQWTYAFDYAKNLAQCDTIFYAFYTYEQGMYREPHDRNNLVTMAAAGYKVVYTIGGWNFNDSMANLFWLDGYQQSKTKIMEVVKDTKIKGIDIDIEWPGLRGLSIDRKDEFIKNVADLCQTLKDNGYLCMMGVQPVGAPLDPDFYKAMYMVDQVNVFGYDLAGCFDLTKPLDQSQLDNTPELLWSLRQEVENIILYFPIERVSMGVPLYTRGYLFDDNGTAVGCWPPAGLADLREDGVDALRVDGSGRVMPRYCIDDTFSSVDQNPTNPSGKVCSGAVGINGKIHTYKIPYGDQSTMVAIRQALYDSYGLTKFFVYAHSMDPDVSILFKNALMPQLRDMKATTIPAYAFPTLRSSGVVSCPGIVTYTATVVVTNRVYKNCNRPDGHFCFYKWSDFTCENTADPPITPKITDVRCKGIDSQLLVQATPQSKRIFCEDGQFFIDQVSICSAVTGSPVAGGNVVIPISVDSDFELYYTTVRSDPVFSYSTIRIPRLCDAFDKPFSCMEYVCAGDGVCMQEFRSSPFIAACQPIAESLNEYDLLMKLVVDSHNSLTSLSSKLLDLSATLHVSATPNPREFSGWNHSAIVRHMLEPRNQRFWGFIIGGIVGMIAGSLMGGGGKDYDGTIQALEQNIKETNNRIDATNKNVAAVAASVVQLQSGLQAFAEDVSHRFDKVEEAFNAMVQDSNEFKAKVAHKFDSLVSIINGLANQIQDLQRKLELSSRLATSIISYTSHVAALTSRLRNYAELITQTRSALLECYSSLLTGSVDGCTSENGTKHLISVDRYEAPTGDIYLVFSYLKMVPRERQGYRGTRAYCSNGVQYVAAQGCLFVQVNDQVYHKTTDLDSCLAPIISFPFKCGPYSVSISTPTIPTGQIAEIVSTNVTVDQTTIASIIEAIKNETFNFTVLEPINYTHITQSSLQQIQMWVEPILEDYKPTWAIVPRGVRAGLDIGIWIVGIIVFLINAIVYAVIFHKIKELEERTEPKLKMA